jgi:hypothetical protein
MNEQPLPEAQGDPVIVATHRRSGTHLTMDTLRRQFTAFHQRLRPFGAFDLLYLSIDRFVAGHFNPITVAEARSRFRRAPRICLKTHLLPGLPGHKPEFSGLIEEIQARASVVYVIRDIRETLISDAMLASAAKHRGPPDFDAYARELEDGLPRPAYWAQHVRLWRAQPRSLVVRFHDLTRTPAEVIRRLGEHLGEEPLMREPLLPAAIKSRPEHIRRRILGDARATNIRGRPKGMPRPPRWQDAFSAATLGFIEAQAGDVLAEWFPAAR